MKISIIFEDDKIILDTSKNVKAKEFFKFIRKRYNILEDKKLILISDRISYDENEKEEKTIEGGLDSSNSKIKKDDYILLSVEDYEKQKSPQQVTNQVSQPSKEEIIMKVTGAETLLKIDRRKKKSMRNSYYGGMIGFDSFLAQRRISPFQSLFYSPFDLPEEEVSQQYDENLEAGESSPRDPSDLHAIGNRLIGRSRARDPQIEAERLEELREYRESRLNSVNSLDLLNSAQIPQSLNYLLQTNSIPTNNNPEEGSLIPQLPSENITSVIRQEDVNHLVNEMGFEEARVRTALRITRNNVNRAVEILLNGPEELLNAESRFANYMPLPFTRNINLGVPHNPNNNTTSFISDRSRLNEIRDRILALRNASREEVLNRQQSNLV